MSDHWTWQVPGGIPATAPCLDGHFPGDPIVPGAVLLGHAALGLARAGLTIAALRRVSFLHPLRPDQDFAIAVRRQGQGAEIRWTAAGTLLALARVTLSTDG